MLNMQNRRGQGLSTSAIVLIILGIVVLVVLILGFTIGWKKFTPFLSTDGNVEEVVTKCQIACSLTSVYDFCSREIVLQSDDLPGELEEVSKTCSFFATEADYQKYGINDCPDLCP